MRQEDRLGLILERLNQHSSVGVPELAAELEVSQASVRRDLQLLEEQQMLTRTRGGAVASGVLYELPMRYRGGQRHEAKRAIAHRAVELIGENVNSIGLNGGSTTTEVARALGLLGSSGSGSSGSQGRLQVVTNALNIASELAVRSQIDLFVTGGSARSESYELIGPVAESSLARLNLDVAVIGVDGVSARGGLTTHHEGEAQTNRAILNAAERIIVVADATKIGRRAFARIGEIRGVSAVVTDKNADPDAITEIERAGVEVHQV